MSFAARETSRYLGKPITLFRFGYGTTIIGYTTSEKPVEFNGDTYRPIAIERNAITQSGSLDKATLNLRLPLGTEIAELFRVFPPSDVVGVTIFQGHHGESEFLAIFVGRVLSCGRKGRVATLNCEPAITSMRRPGLRRRWQYPCPHVLYGAQCKASRDDHKVTASVESVDGTYVTMAAGWSGSLPTSAFENGLIQWGGEIRNILQVNENTLVVSGRVSGLVAGTAASLLPGCKHTMADCQNVFNNILNFGGDPWIPIKNPVGFVNQFY